MSTRKELIALSLVKQAIDRALAKPDECAHDLLVAHAGIECAAAIFAGRAPTSSGTAAYNEALSAFMDSVEGLALYGAE